MPGPKSRSGTFGNPCRTWLQLFDVRAAVPDPLQLCGRQAVRPCVLSVDRERDAVVGHEELDVADPGGMALGRLGQPDRPGGVGQVGLVLAEALEAAARAGDPDDDAGTAVLALIRFGSGLRERRDRAGAVRLDGSPDRLRACHGGRNGRQCDGRSCTADEQELANSHAEVPFQSPAWSQAIEQSYARAMGSWEVAVWWRSGERGLIPRHPPRRSPRPFVPRRSAVPSSARISRPWRSAPRCRGRR